MLSVIAAISLSVFFGFVKPHRTAWAIVLFVPLLGPGGFYIGVDTFLPLNTYRLGFFALFAILIKLRMSVIDIVYKNKFTHIIVIYFIVIFLLEIKDYFVPAIATMLPFYSLAIFIPFIIIKDEKDLYRIAFIFALQAVFIAFFVIIEYYTDFSIAVFIRQFSGVETIEMQTKGGGGGEIIRSGFYRVAGLHGNAVQTAYHLVFLFPFTIFYWQNKTKITRFIPLSLVLLAFILLQTRAAMLALVAMVLLLILLSLSKRHLNKTALKFLRILIIIGIGIFILSFFNKNIFQLAENFISGLMAVITNDTAHVSAAEDITGKLDRIPRALKFIYNSPIYGYLVSPRYAYFEIMDTDDLPSIFLHLIGGGLLLGGLFITLMVKIVRGVFVEIKKIQTNKLKDLLLYFTVAAFGGFLVTFSAWAEEHYLSIFLMFIAIKYFLIIKEKLNFKKIRTK